MMYCMIPIPIGYSIPVAIIESLDAQSFVPAIKVFQSEGDHGGSREAIRYGNYLNCVKMQDFCSTINDEFVMYQDSDIIHLDKDNIKNMLDFLDANKNYGGISVSHRNLSRDKDLSLGHINSPCCVVRRQVFLMSKFSPNYCQCMAMATAARDIGLLYGYLSDKKLVVTVPR